MSKKEQTILEEAADKHIRRVADAAGHPGWDWTTQDIADAFIAGVEWQKEQDQPITGNSLEQEWLRYIGRKKKECRGELPALGEYGWLQIARHFAEWQKNQMLKDAVEWTVTTNLANRPVIYLDQLHGFEYGDKVLVLVLKAEEE